MPHSYLKVVGNLGYGCNNSSPRYMRENHYAILVSNLRISYVFKYKISITLLIFLICLGKGCPNPNTKVQKVRDMSFNYHGLYFDLQLNTSVLSWLRYSDCFPKLIHLLSEPAYM